MSAASYRSGGKVKQAANDLVPRCLLGIVAIKRFLIRLGYRIAQVGRDRRKPEVRRHPLSRPADRVQLVDRSHPAGLVEVEQVGHLGATVDQRLHPRIVLGLVEPVHLLGPTLGTLRQPLIRQTSAQRFLYEPLWASHFDLCFELCTRSGEYAYFAGDTERSHREFLSVEERVCNFDQLTQYMTLRVSQAEMLGIPFDGNDERLVAKFLAAAAEE